MFFLFDARRIGGVGYVEDDAEIEDPENVLTLTDARELAPEVEVGAELRFYKDTSPLGRIAA
ncbi:MAG: hypothetical protein V4710_11795, partial [Verrucomicrobiota bacterium]